MNYKKVAINIAILTIILTASASTVSAYGDIDSPLEFRGRGGIRGRGQYSQGHNQAALDAIEDHDYEAWKNAIGNDSYLVKAITKDNFEKFIQVRSLAREGKYNQALTLSEELGLKLHKKLYATDANHIQDRRQREKNSIMTMEAARTALDANDYESWKRAVEDVSLISEKITKENFYLLVQSHKLMQSGKFADAAAIREKLGLNVGRGLRR